MTLLCWSSTDICTCKVEWTLYLILTISISLTWVSTIEHLREGDAFDKKNSVNVAFRYCFSIELPGGSAVKNLPAVIQSIDREDPLQEGIATHYSILAWRIPWTEEPGGLPSMGSWRVGHNWGTNTSTSTVFIKKKKKYGLVPHNWRQEKQRGEKERADHQLGGDLQLHKQFSLSAGQKGRHKSGK